MRFSFGAFAGAIAFIGGTASAGDLTYSPVVPSLGGDPFIGAHLLSLADIQNLHEDDGDDFDNLFEEPTVADDFVAAMRSTAISGSTGELLENVFNRQGPPNGTITLDGAMVTYQTLEAEGLVRITINDGIETNVLTLPIPEDQ